MRCNIYSHTTHMEYTGSQVVRKVKDFALHRIFYMKSVTRKIMFQFFNKFSCTHCYVEFPNNEKRNT